MTRDNIVSIHRQQHQNDARAYEDAVRAQRGGDPFPIVDYPERQRFVRPMAPVDMAEWSGDPNLDLYRSIEQQERRERVDASIRSYERMRFWQGMVKGFCIAVAYLTVIYFFWQLGRGVL